MTKKFFYFVQQSVADMTEQGLNWSLKGLGAKGPHPEYMRKLGLFGQFVGDWVGEATFVRENGSEIPGGRGEVHFEWILDGRAIQDVWMYEDVSAKRMIPAGTTIRFYDPERDVWQSTWISPLQNTTLTFTGREFEGEIVLETRNKLGKNERWIFYDIKKDSSFKWRSEVSDDEGKTWKVTSKYFIKRAEKQQQYP